MACVISCKIPSHIKILSGHRSAKVITFGQNGRKVCYENQGHTECCPTIEGTPDEGASCDDCKDSFCVTTWQATYDCGDEAWSLGVPSTDCIVPPDDLVKDQWVDTDDPCVKSYTVVRSLCSEHAQCATPSDPSLPTGDPGEDCCQGPAPCTCPNAEELATSYSIRGYSYNGFFGPANHSPACDVTGRTAWDGVFYKNESNPETPCYWDASTVGYPSNGAQDSFKFQLTDGFEVSSVNSWSLMLSPPLPGISESCFWFLTIASSCDIGPSGWLWAGIKEVGSTPAGLYHRVQGNASGPATIMIE